MSYVRLLYHIIFRPRCSAPVISAEHEEMLYRYIWGFAREKGAVLYRIGGMPDHIHLFVQLPATTAVADFVRDMKIASSGYMKEHLKEFPLFDGWAKAYCALSYSESEKDSVVNYIRNQKAHHSRVSFRDELLAILHEQKVDVDMRYFLAE